MSAAGLYPGFRHLAAPLSDASCQLLPVMRRTKPVSVLFLVGAGQAGQKQAV